jgi:hypothetical protein
MSERDQATPLTLVSRYLAERQRERDKLEAFKNAPIEEKPRQASGVQMDML